MSKNSYVENRKDLKVLTEEESGLVLGGTGDLSLSELSKGQVFESRFNHSSYFIISRDVVIVDGNTDIYGYYGSFVNGNLQLESSAREYSSSWNYFKGNYLETSYAYTFS